MAPNVGHDATASNNDQPLAFDILTCGRFADKDRGEGISTTNLSSLRDGHLDEIAREDNPRYRTFYQLPLPTWQLCSTPTFNDCNDLYAENLA